jgi:hypothetical protein
VRPSDAGELTRGGGRYFWSQSKQKSKPTAPPASSSPAKDFVKRTANRVLGPAAAAAAAATRTGEPASATQEPTEAAGKDARVVLELQHIKLAPFKTIRAPSFVCVAADETWCVTSRRH